MTRVLASGEVRGVRIALEFKPADLWVGAYWERRVPGREAWTHVWVCALPCLPIHLAWRAS